MNSKSKRALIALPLFFLLVASLLVLLIVGNFSPQNTGKFDRLNPSSYILENKTPTVQASDLEKSKSEPVQTYIDPNCKSREVHIVKKFDKEEWVYLDVPQVNMKFEYPVQAGVYSYEYYADPICTIPTFQPLGEAFRWEFDDMNGNRLSIAGGASEDNHPQREGWYTDIKDLQNVGSEFVFRGGFLGGVYLKPLKLYKTKYNTDAVIVDVYEFHKSINDRYAEMFDEKKGDYLLVVKLPNNNSNFKAMVLYLPKWLDYESVDRVVQSITL